MKIYTRTGDSGSTGVFGGPRVSKDDARIEACGTVDELNAALGLARATGLAEDIDGQLATIQSELFSVGAELATPDPEKHGLRCIGVEHIETMERWIDQHDQQLEPLSQFILPAGTTAACQLHVARAVCRRAERRVVTLAGRPDVDVSEMMIVYLNRLSDLLFVLARVVNRRSGVPESPWVSVTR